MYRKKFRFGLESGVGVCPSGNRAYPNVIDLDRAGSSTVVVCVYICAFYHESNIHLHLFIITYYNITPTYVNRTCKL